MEVREEERDVVKMGCRVHQEFYDDECSWCKQADIYYRRLKEKTKEDANFFRFKDAP